MKLFIFFAVSCALIGSAALKLESIPRLDTASALKILIASQQESLNQKVDVAIIVVGLDGRILASSKSEKMWPQLYDFAKYKAQTSWFKACCTEDLKSRTSQVPEILNMDRLKVIRGVKGGVPLFYKGHLVGAVGVSGAHPDIDKAIAVKGVNAIKELEIQK